MTPDATTPPTITVSLDWAKKLREAGWPRLGSIFWWRCYTSKGMDSETWVLETIDRYWPHADGRRYTYSEPLAAPTAEEILRRLPKFITEDGMVHRRHVHWDYGDNRVEYGRNHVYCADAESLANAAAAMYCYLAEQNLLPSPHEA